ncbi:VanZ family protein [Flavobacterium sp. WC2509]|uniref:VanZ family protein n=1 Tax=Flavobacterium sp. WC2509 TaxID=3461406 RepID=UPI004044B750
MFTFVWFLFFYKQFNSDSIFKPLLISFLFSFVFGITIEVLQGLVTSTRSADVLDGVANLVGASLAVLTVIICNKYNILKIIIKN